MRLDDMKRSDNVEDRRGFRPVHGFGIGTVVLLVVGYFMGVSPSTLMSLIGVGESVTQGGAGAQQQGVTGRPHDPQGDFAAAVLGETEVVWTKYFAAAGKQYTPPTLVLFSGEVASACGDASTASGPFYCPGDQKVYIDLDFFNQLASDFGAPGDFARAYVLAHEVGHHVQNLLGLTNGPISAGASGGSVAIELQADCLAGVWAMQDQRIIEPGEVQQALAAAAAVGDDTLQKRTQGRVVPDTFTHGTSAQRQHWFERGFQGGKIESCDTQSASQL